MAQVYRNRRRQVMKTAWVLRKTFGMSLAAALRAAWAALKLQEQMLERDIDDIVNEYVQTFHVELPVLEGTPKQVAWANDIRTRFVDAHVRNTVAEMRRLYLEARSNVETIADNGRLGLALLIAADRKARAFFARQKSAKWYIEHRFDAQFKRISDIV